MGAKGGSKERGKWRRKRRVGKEVGKKRKMSPPSKPREHSRVTRKFLETPLTKTSVRARYGGS